MITLPVTPLPSGQYGVYAPARASYEHAPVLQVAQKIRGEWHGTPARYYASTLAGLRADETLAIDYGAGWRLSREDTAALADHARQSLIN